MGPWIKSFKRLSWELLIIFLKQPFYPICLLESSLTSDREGIHVIAWIVLSGSSSLPGIINLQCLRCDFAMLPSRVGSYCLWTWQCDCFSL